MSEPYIGEIRIFGFDYAPRGWAFCDGAILAISTNQALFSILGTNYGGNGINTFGLPNLQGRVPIHVSSSYPVGATGGEETHVLTTMEVPSHSHSLIGSSNAADQPIPTNNFLAVTEDNYYIAAANQTLAGGALTPVGGVPHENRPPYLTLNFCIALTGIFPSRQ